MTAVLEASDWLNSQLSNLIPARPSAWTTMYALVNLNIHIHMATHVHICMYTSAKFTIQNQQDIV